MARQKSGVVDVLEVASGSRKDHSNCKETKEKQPAPFHTANTSSRCALVNHGTGTGTAQSELQERGVYAASVGNELNLKFNPKLSRQLY
jgi:hypothetical protein